MPHSVTFRNGSLDGGSALGAYISLHTADPGTTGASEVVGGTYARVQTTWGTSTNGAKTGSQVTLNIPASTTITHWGCWTAASAGTYLAGGLLSSASAYTAAGTYNITPTLTAASGV